MKACLLIHGFTGSPFEIKPLAEALSQQGYVVETPVLAGHGMDEDLLDVCWTDWIRSAENALKPMLGKYEEINVVGFSMGTLIAAYLSTQYPVTKLVLLSPAIYFINYRQLFENMSVAIKNKFEGSISEELKFYMQKATNTPLRSVIDFRRLTKHLTPYVEQITVPTLILHGKMDALVEADSAQQAYEVIKSEDKKLIFLEKSQHIMCHGEESGLINQYVIDFFQQNELSQ